MVTVGLDEVGRGCWAGPLVAGAVVLQVPILGLRDSKALSKRQREQLVEHIYRSALRLGLGWVHQQEIDQLGLTSATTLAMQRALAQIDIAYDQIIIDGNVNYLSSDARTITIVKADKTIPSVSAASIIAKVARDNWMATVAAKNFPNYGFETHVGYGTKLHRQRLALHGPCVLHRHTFKPVREVVLLNAEFQKML